METKQAASDKTSEDSKRLIDANKFVKDFLSLTLTVTGLRNGKGVMLELLNKFRNGVLQLVNEEPTVDAAPVVHGDWITWEQVDNFIPSPKRHECSVCHDAAQVLVNGMELLSPYCPNCGAKMDGGASPG